MPKRLPDNCVTLYADLMQKVLDSAIVTLAGGSFTSKMIGDARYWYYQLRTLTGQTQKYLGKETPELLELIEKAKQDRASASAILNERRRLVSMLIAGGASAEKGRPAKILGKMSDSGLFASGGVLVGSFAFGCYGNVLGVHMEQGLSRTEDMDFSDAREMNIGFVRNMKADLVEAEPSLATPPQINPRIVPFEMRAPDGFKIEFLTTRVGVHDKSPVLIERLGVHAQPLEYMDYLLDQTQPAVILNGAGILVAIPQPARYAAHKLAVSQLRETGNQPKIKKDINQACALMRVLMEDNPGVLDAAFEAVIERDDHMGVFVRKGFALLPEDVKAAARQVCGSVAQIEKAKISLRT
ncbi:MAG: GSU2403 family nucleotidyltransferase fold protein [Gallionella sp.]